MLPAEARSDASFPMETRKGEREKEPEKGGKKREVERGSSLKKKKKHGRKSLSYRRYIYFFFFFLFLRFFVLFCFVHELCVAIYKTTFLVCLVWFNICTESSKHAKRSSLPLRRLIEGERNKINKYNSGQTHPERLPPVNLVNVIFSFWPCGKQQRTSFGDVH